MNRPFRRPTRALPTRSPALALAVVIALTFATFALPGGEAQARGRARWGIGIGIGVPVYPSFGYGYAYPHAYPYGVYGPPVYGNPVVVAPPPEPVPSQPDPIFYPRQGQSPAQTEAERQDCNRWAMGQPGALPDARIFHRATLACMEGRGYTVR